MAFYFHGIELTSDSFFVNLNANQVVNVTVSGIPGTSRRDIEIGSMKEETLDISILLGKQWTSDLSTAQQLVSLLKGIVRRRHPVHLLSEEVDLYEDSSEVFVVVKDINYEYATGRLSGELVVKVNLKCEVIGTPATLLGKVIANVVRRGNDWDGLIPSQSTIGLPTSSENASVTLLATRLGTPMVNLGNLATGFANDTLTAVAGEISIGKITYELDTSSLTFLDNACKVYDEGYSPRRRVISTEHKFLGNCTLESDLYKIIVIPASSKFEIYKATSLGTYEGTAFETFFFPDTGFDKVILTHANDEFLRVRTNMGEFIEIERGKDPVITLAQPEHRLRYSVSDTAGGTASQQYDNAAAVYDTATYASLETEFSTNYVPLNAASNIYVASNRHFTIAEGTKDISPSSSPVPADIVYKIIADDISTSLRNREVLIEIN